jgi:aspartyl protease family protein
MRVRGRLFWSLWIGLALVLFVLLLNRADGLQSGMAKPDFAWVAAQVAFAAVVGSLAFAAFRRRWSEALQALLFWIVLAGVLLVGYTFRSELRALGDRVLADLIPGRPVQIGRAVEITRARSGEFLVAAQVNGADLRMVLDSGASSVVLTPEAAKAAGVPVQMLSYSVTIETANGRARAASVTLDRVAIGSIVERSVPALVAQPGQLRVSLLGMSFLNRLASWEVRSDHVVLRPR